MKDNSSDIEFLSSNETSAHTKESNKKRKREFNPETNEKVNSNNKR
jgi:hypothetical protein